MNGISIIVCTYNGSVRIAETLISIINQSKNINYELIIVNNASNDNTEEFCRNFLFNQARDFRWKIIYEDSMGLSFARLRGIKEAFFDIVLFVDDDNILDTNYIKIGFSKFFENPNLGVLGGCGFPIFEQSPPKWFSKFSHSFAVGHQYISNGRILNYPAEVYGAGAFFRKKPLLDLFNKGFNAILSDRKGNSLMSGGDVEWCYLLQLLGYEIWYENTLIFQHKLPKERLTWEYYLKLKKGIADGSGLLFAYNFYFSNGADNLLKFIFTYFFRCIYFFISYIKLIIMNLISPSKKEEYQLGIVIIKNCFFSFLKNFTSSFSHYKKLSKI